ncbi:GNAT family N-acetyltransferase [Streptomyces sp. NPDC090025]|uniref:GNAT family N-acetyltransferase n=1 Tax=Streptomyces sp. NPDC090025 TaxID=3365922 RepID=UPI0038348E84
MLHTPRDHLDLLIGWVAGADSAAQHWLGDVARKEPVDPRQVETLLRIDRGNRDKVMRALPDARRAQMAAPFWPSDGGPTSLLLVVEEATGRVAGLSQLTIGTERGNVMGGWLAPDFRGRGFGAEAARATLRFGHEHLGLEAVRAGTDPSNEASRRVLAATGFVPAAGPARHTLADGRVIDALWFEHAVARDATARCAAGAPAR